MELEKAIESLKEYTRPQVEALQFNLDKNIHFTLELKPEWHDTMLKACDIVLSERA